MRTTWRDDCKPLIEKVIKQVGTDDMKALMVALREAYPYGERAMWPYKVWCDEIRRQLGTKPPLGYRPPPQPAVGQQELF